MNQVLKKASIEHKIPFWKTVFCVKWICRNDKQIRLQAKMVRAFESNLDIRRLVDQQINLAGLVRLLLNAPQQVLFQLQRDRAVIK